MKYIKSDRLFGGIEHQSDYPTNSFIEIDEEGYEQRLISFYGGNTEQFIGFTDGQRQ